MPKNNSAILQYLYTGAGSRWQLDHINTHRVGNHTSGELHDILISESLLPSNFNLFTSLSTQNGTHFLNHKNPDSHTIAILQKTIDAVNKTDAELLKTRIEEYRFTDNLTNWWSPLHIFVEEKLVVFYYLVCSKCVFDAGELEVIYTFCVLYFITYMFNPSWRKMWIKYLTQWFGVDRDHIYQAVKPTIEKYMCYYIDKQYPDQPQKIQEHADLSPTQIQIIIKGMQSNQTSYMMTEYLVDFLVEIQTEESNSILQQLRTIAYHTHDGELVTTIDRYTVFGKQGELYEQAWKDKWYGGIPTGSVDLGQWTTIYTRSYILHVEDKYIVFEDRDHWWYTDEATATRLSSIGSILDRATYTNHVNGTKTIYIRKLVEHLINKNYHPPIQWFPEQTMGNDTQAEVNKIFNEIMKEYHSKLFAILGFEFQPELFGIGNNQT